MLWEILLMGKGKKKRAAKRRNQMKNRNAIKEKMGKPIFFTLTHCSKKLSGVSNKYNYKANMHNLCFVGARFYNVKYQASIMTGCNFRDAHLIGIDFYNCNMRDISFKNTTFENVVFYNCNLKNADFNGAKFSNVVIICTKLSNIKNFNKDVSGLTIIRSYPKLCINEITELNLLKLAENDSIYKAKVLHVNKAKLNNWSLSIVESRCGVEGIEFLAKVLNKKEKWDNLYTVYSYISLIENLRK
jgi:hypothetical protein